ncbi:MAG: hypothetical protein AAF676_10010 [Pseudomonadota bacterium]
MRKPILVIVALVAFGVAGYTFYTSWRLQDPEYQRQRTLGMLDAPLKGRQQVDLDVFAGLRPAKEGTRDILVPAPIEFEARVLAAPEPIKTDYLSTALSMVGVSPIPQVGHRMFVETDEGLVVPVYVWQGAVDAFAPGERPLRMVGHHVYTYRKGPAIVVDGRA